MSNLVITNTEVRYLEDSDFNSPLFMLPQTRETFVPAYGPLVASGTLTTLDAETPGYWDVGLVALGVPESTGNQWAWTKIIVQNLGTTALRFLYQQTPAILTDAEIAAETNDGAAVEMALAPGSITHLTVPLNLDYYTRGIVVQNFNTGPDSGNGRFRISIAVGEVQLVA